MSATAPEENVFPMPTQEPPLQAVSQMPPIQALQNLDIACSKAPLSRQEHAIVTESLRVLARALNVPIQGEP